MFAKADIAKMAIHTLVASQVAKVVSTFIADNTDFEEDALRVKIGSLVVGDVVASQTDVITDSIVDRIASKYNERKANKTVTEES